MTTDLLERLRRAEATALEELGHALLPFVQAAAIANNFDAPDAGALLQMFREEVSLADTKMEADAFFAALRSKLRARAKALPTVRPDIAQGDALSRLARLEPLTQDEREVVISRFVERLPAEPCTRHFGLDVLALAAILSRGAVLLVGPAAPNTDWAASPSLLVPDAEPVAQFVELENVVGCLAVDVTAFEPSAAVSPSKSLLAPVLVLKSGFEPQAPQESYPSRIETKQLVDLPAEMAGLPRVAVKPDESTDPHSTALPGVPFAPERTEPRGAPLLPWSDQTVPQPAPQVVPWNDNTEPRAAPLPFSEESTQTNARPLSPPPEELTEIRVKTLNIAPSHFGANRGQGVTDGKGYFADVNETTQVGVSLLLPPGPLPLHHRLPSRWWFAIAAFCAVLGTSLYLGTLSYLRTTAQSGWKLLPVVVAARDLPEGTRITLEQLAIRAVPEAHVTTSVVRPSAIEYALGQKLEFPLQAGDPLLWSQFDPARKFKRFEVVKKGRAYTIAVTELKSVGGLLLPREEVDLIMTLAPTPSRADAKPSTRAITVLQKVRVLAVGPVSMNNINKVQRRSTDVTLMLVPEEVETLSLARRMGDITATLRNVDDDAVISRGETIEQTLLSGVRLKAVENRRGAMISNIRKQPR